MVIGQTIATTEVLVVGAGPGGYVAAIRLAQLGFEVMLVDKKGELGGMCLHHGCIPSKALIHATHLYHEATHGEPMGVRLQGSLDFRATQAWKKSVVDRLASGIKDLCVKHKIIVVKGTVHFQNPTQVIIDGEGLDFNAIEFRFAVIATGSKPRAYKGVPFGDRILSSWEFLELQEVPKTLMVIGGGYIGIELGVMMRKAGAAVTVIETTGTILGAVEPELAAVAQKQLNVLGIETVLNANVEKITQDAQGATVVAGGKTYNADRVLVAVGHEPVIENIGLDNAGVKLNERGFIAVDSQCRTSMKNIFAVGDIVGGMMLAHKAFAQGKVAAEAIAGMPSVFEPQCIPAVIFSDPEIGTVGLRESEARERHGEILVGKFPFAALGKALAMRETEGFVKIVADKNGTVLGVHAVGPGVTDYISEAALAIEMGANAEDIALTIHPHPTLGESLGEAAEALLGKSIHLYQPKK